MSQRSAPPDIDWHEIADRRAARLAELERRVTYLAAERDRYARLLGMTLEVAAGGQADPYALLEVVAAACGTDLARAAYTEKP